MFSHRTWYVGTSLLIDVVEEHTRDSKQACRTKTCLKNMIVNSPTWKAKPEPVPSRVENRDFPRSRHRKITKLSPKRQHIVRTTNCVVYHHKLEHPGRGVTCHALSQRNANGTSNEWLLRPLLYLTDLEVNTGSAGVATSSLLYLSFLATSWAEYDTSCSKIATPPSKIGGSHAKVTFELIVQE